MIVWTKYDLKDDSDSFDYKMSQKAAAMYSSIWDVYNFLRSKHKHVEYKSKEANQLIDEVYQYFMDNCGEFLD